MKEHEPHHKISRTILVEFTGTMEDVEFGIKTITETLSPMAKRPLYISYWGCDGCGCPTKNWSPNETPPCEDELCGHDCETCGCYDYEAAEAKDNAQALIDGYAKD